MSQFEFSLFRTIEGREIEIEIVVDYDYQEYNDHTGEEEGLLINSIMNLDDEVVVVTDYERTEIERELLEFLSEPAPVVEDIE